MTGALGWALRRRSARRTSLGAALLVATATATSAQAGEPSDAVRRERLVGELRALAALEALAVGDARRRTSGRPKTSATNGSVAAREHRVAIEALLDTLVLQRTTGAAELASLERAYPGSPLLLRTRADLAVRDGRPHEALVGYERLLRAAPRDAVLARRRARALLLLPDTGRALAAWTTVLDAVPEDREAFDILLRLRSATNTLPVLQGQLQRLRLLSGDSLLLRGREAEVQARRRRSGVQP